MRLLAGILLIISLGFTLGPALHFLDIPLSCCSVSACHMELTDSKYCNSHNDDNLDHQLVDSCCSSAENEKGETEEDKNTCNPFHCFHCVKVFLTLNFEFSVFQKNILVSSITPPYIPHKGIQYQLAVWHPPLFV